MAIKHKKEKNSSEWYTEVITKSGLIDYSSVSGAMVFRPWVYAIWEKVVAETDKRFKEIGIKTHEVIKTENMPLKGKRFVFTGGLQSLSRPDASDVIKQKGGVVSSSVSRDTDYIVVGEKPGSKIKKAKKLGITILNEEEFKILVGK